MIIDLPFYTDNFYMRYLAGIGAEIILLPFVYRRFPPTCIERRNPNAPLPITKWLTFQKLLIPVIAWDESGAGAPSRDKSRYKVAIFGAPAPREDARRRPTTELGITGVATFPTDSRYPRNVPILMGFPALRSA